MTSLPATIRLCQMVGRNRMFIEKNIFKIVKFTNELNSEAINMADARGTWSQRPAELRYRWSSELLIYLHLCAIVARLMFSAIGNTQNTCCFLGFLNGNAFFTRLKFLRDLISRNTAIWLTCKYSDTLLYAAHRIVDGCGAWDANTM